MKVKFWGVRGDIPCPGIETVKYGGNTMCIEIRLSNPDRILIIDAGSGIRELGNQSGCKNYDILLTHTHWDHIMGLPYFKPMYTPGTNLRIFGPVNYKEDTLAEIISGLFEYDYFHLKLEELPAKIEFIDIKEGIIDLGFDDIRITSKILNHPILCLGYKIQYKNNIICFVFDTEPFHNLWNYSEDHPEYDLMKIKQGEEVAEKLNQEISTFFAGADLLIHDGQFTDKAYYKSKIGFGHYPMELAINTAKKAGVKKLALVHHDPLSTDTMLDKLSEKLCSSEDPDGIQVFFAREGMEIRL